MSKEDYKDCDEYKECTELALERMRYFTGRFMTARDFRDEQAYHLTHRLLHNRILHGWGVVCGLYVSPHPSTDCQKDHVRVSPGMAVDCCGREVVVDKSLVPPPIPWKEMPDYRQDVSSQDEEHERDHRRYYPLLCLVYQAEPIEQVPVLYSEGNCDEQRREFSRIRDGYKFEWRWVRRRDLPAYQWKVRGGGCRDKQDDPNAAPDADQQAAQPGQVDAGQAYQQHSGHQPHGDSHPCPQDDCDPDSERSCLDLDCPPHHCIPIALIQARPHTPIDKKHIDVAGRPMLRPPAPSLTHICEINWPHGGAVSSAALSLAGGNRLEVRFDRRLKKTNERRGPTGINASTFVVEYGGREEDLDFVPYSSPPAIEDDDRLAVYSMRPDDSNDEGNVFSYLENKVIFVTIRCDFVLDCHDLPVDGNHLGGLLPTGDGVRGGTFESWFRVLSESGYQKYLDEQGHS